MSVMFVMQGTAQLYIVEDARVAHVMNLATCEVAALGLSSTFQPSRWTCTMIILIVMVVCPEINLHDSITDVLTLCSSGIQDGCS